MTERADGARGRDVVPIAAILTQDLRTSKLFGALVAHLDVTEAEKRTDILEEARLLADRLDERHAQMSSCDA